MGARMIPQDRLSTTTLAADFLGARASSAITARYDMEDGGVALQDPSEGLFSDVWYAYINPSNTRIILGKEGGSEVTIIEGTGITEVSLTFDRNMNVAIAYVEGGEAKLNWFDLVANDQVTTNFGSTYINPRVSHDDKHPLASETSDVIFAYVRDGDLYYRQQRDRYDTERLLQEDVAGTFRKIGMNVENRLQFEFS